MKWPFVRRSRFDATVAHYKEAVDDYAAENALLWEKNDQLARLLIEAEKLSLVRPAQTVPVWPIEGDRFST